MKDFEEKRFFRRIALSAVAYLLFVYYVMHSPGESILTNISAIALIFGFFALFVFLVFVILAISVLLVSYLFYFWGGNELKEWVQDSLNKATGLFAALIVLFLIALPLKTILNDPYRFPYLYSFLNSILSAILKK